MFEGAARPVAFSIGLLVFVLIGCSDSPLAPSNDTDLGSRGPSLTFESEDFRSMGFGFAIIDASKPHFNGSPWTKAGTVSLAIHGENIVASRVTGTVRWDPSLLEFDAWSRGVIMEQEGAEGVVDYMFTNGAFPGQFTFSARRPNRTGVSSGDGPIVYFRLRPRPGVTSGRSSIVWDDAAAYQGSGVRRSLCVQSSQQHCLQAFSGTVIIGR